MIISTHRYPEVMIKFPADDCLYGIQADCITDHL
jgi:hypothetical protein